jgi:hypothetical protein
MNSTNVTIVIPTYNRARLLEISLGSALSQDYSDFQVVVLDNASTDDTERVVRSFKDTRVTYIRNETNIGLFRNENKAIEVNRSPFLSILHDDDVLLPGFIVESTLALERHPRSGFSIVQATAININGESLNDNAKNTSDRIREGIMDGLEFLHGIVDGRKWITHFSTVMMRAEALSASGYFDSSHSKDTTDINLFYRLAARFDIVFIPKTLCHVRFHSSQESRLHYDSALSTGPVAVLAERIDAVGHLMRSSRAAEAPYREWLADRLIDLNHYRSEETHRLIPALTLDRAQRLAVATHDIQMLIPAGERFILVDGNEWGPDVTVGRQTIPFLECDGVYWGPPPDDATAIRELERIRESGVNYIVFGWPTFWWFDYYVGLRHYLQAKFRCLLKNSRLIAFDLRG